MASPSSAVQLLTTHSHRDVENAERATPLLSTIPRSEIDSQDAPAKRTYAQVVASSFPCRPSPLNTSSSLLTFPEESAASPKSPRSIMPTSPNYTYKNSRERILHGSVVLSIPNSTILTSPVPPKRKSLRLLSPTHSASSNLEIQTTRARRSESGLFEKLPDEILLTILQLSSLSPVDLSRIARVSRRFFFLADDQSLWKMVSLEPFRAIIDDISLQILCETKFSSMGPKTRLQSLDLSGCSNLTDVSISMLAKSAPGLISLNLIGCNKVSDKGIIEIARNCYKLRVLNMQFCDLTDASLVALANTFDRDEEGCPELQVLDVTWCHRITDRGLKALARGCPDLKRLAVACNGFISEDGVTEIVQHCHQLRELDLSLCDLVSDRVLDTIGLHAKNLEELNIIGCPITSRGLHAFLKYAPSGLKVVSLD